MGDTNYPPTDGSGGSFGAATSGAAVRGMPQPAQASPPDAEAEGS